jgi:GTP:adenosylcobinamide-phosphate guanylyltransferase
MKSPDPAADRAQVRTALLLAAGLGSRLAPLTDAVPKCLVSVGGMPILERLVRSLDTHGFERLVVVTGYQADAIRGYLGESFAGIAFEYILSPLFETTNNIYSLWLARDLIDEPFLLVESDLVFEEHLLAPLLQPDRIAVSRQLPWMSGTTVTLDGGGNVNAFYPPPPGVYGQHCTDIDHFMAVNMCSLARETWGDVRERLDQHVAAGQTGLFYESVFEEMAADGSMAPLAVIFPAFCTVVRSVLGSPGNLDGAAPHRFGVGGHFRRTQMGKSSSPARTRSLDELDAAAADIHHGRTVKPVVLF